MFQAAAAASETAASTPFVPDLGGGAKGTPAPTMSPSAPFLLRAHPKRWTVLGDQVIPALGKLVLQDGVNGSSRQRDGKLRSSEARARAEDRGWTIIPHTAMPPAHVAKYGPSYLKRPIGRPDVTMLVYEDCFPGSADTRRRDAEYGEFCAWLLDTGIIPQPPLYALQRLAAQLLTSAQSAADKSKLHSEYAATAAETARQHAIVQARVDAMLTVDAAPAPTEAAALDDDPLSLQYDRPRARK